MKKRLTICVFWDKEGVLRDYALFYIKALKEFSYRFLVVVNGLIADDAKKTLEELGCEVIKRKNLALDFGAYKYGLSYVGFDKLDEFDNVILTNTTCYGPVFPFSEMFDEMDGRECDFWGITEHSGYEDKEWLKKRVQPHIQSYFLVFKKNIFSSKIFFNFFNSVQDDKALPYKQIINLYETELTHYFESNGFKSSCYMDCKSYYDEKNLNPCYFSTVDLIKNERLPLVKRKALIFDPDTSMKSYHANKCIELLKCIKDKTSYDTNMIMTDLIRDYPLSKLKFAFHLSYVLPEDHELQATNTLYSDVPSICAESKLDSIICNDKYDSTKKCALILFVNSLNHIEEILLKVANLPENSSIFFVTKNDNDEHSLKDLVLYNKNINELFSSFNLVFRNGSESTDIYDAYFVICKDVFNDFEYVFCLQSFDDSYLATDKLYKEFYSDKVNSLLSSKLYVKNILNKLDKDPYVGLVINNLPLTNAYDDIMWGKDIYMIDNPEIIYRVRKFYNLHVPMDNGNLCCYCGIFIARSKALKQLLDKPFDFNFLRSSGITLDYVVRSALDFIIPQIVQEASYLTTSSIPLSESSKYMDCMFYNNRVTEYEPCPTVYNFKKQDYDRKYIRRFTFNDFCKYLFTVRKSPDSRYKYLTICGFNIMLKPAKGRR